MKPGASFLSLLLLLALSLQPAAAQQSTHTLFIDYLDSQDYPTMRLSISAWDENGLPLENLQNDHFAIREDGGDPISPSSLVIDTQAPLRILLLVDVSESMRGQPLQDAKSAAARFIDRLDARKDQIALLAFSSSLDPDPTSQDPQREIGFTNQFNQVYDLVENMEANGQTELYQAAAKAAAMFQDQPQGHRAVLLLSDGRNEPADSGDPEQAIQLARELRIPFFVIGLGPQVDQAYLQRLAFETGGLFLPVPSSAQLSEMFNQAATLLKTRYQLTYVSRLPADGEPHSLQVSLDTSGVQSQALLDWQAPFVPTAVPPTETLAPTETPLPTAAPTLAPSPTAVLAATATPMVAAPAIIAPVEPVQAACQGPLESLECFVASPLSWLLGLVLLGGLLWLLFRPRKKPQPEACAQCGYDLTGLSGPCPQCGETRRLPRLKK